MVLSKDLKQAIAFGLIVGCIFQLLTVIGFCSEPEVVPTSVAQNVGITANSDTFISSAYNTGYVELEPGFIYTVSVTRYRTIGFSDSVPSVGISVYDVTSIPANSSFTFSSNSYNYLYFDFYYDSDVIVTREPLVGLSNFVDKLIYDLSIDNLSSVWVLVVPILAISVLVGLGVYFLYRLFRKIKRARGGV